MPSASGMTWRMLATAPAQIEGGGQLADRLDGLVGDTVGPAVLGGGLVVHVPRLTDPRPA